ncbi:MAG: N-acetylmuramoyl-L-alanine amidase [Chitinophagaceae bacterium]|nr:N-acetylmuramoyl-L-alanine amidase [Chitinophagaceae bacterium]
MLLQYLGEMIRITIFILALFICHAIASQEQIITGKTTGNNPYLEYGLGADRLGGAKMTFLDTGVVLKVTDSTLMNYKVQLSVNHFAYLPKVNFVKDSTIQIKKYYLAGSMLINGDDCHDFVAVSLDERLPYRSIQQISPSRIVVDIFGATSNTNWITQRTSAKEIKNIYYEQIEDDVYRVIIELKNQQHWGYSIFYEGKRLVIKVKLQPAELYLKKLKVAIDAGHGGDNTGAIGKITGMKEKDYNLLIAQELEKELKKSHAAVFMTRTKDTSLTMTGRLEMIKQAEPDFLISIHLNSSSKDSINGVSTYYRYIGFRPLSQHIQQNMLDLGLGDFGNVGGFNFSLSGPTEYPNCLVEVAFLSNAEDEKKILDPEFRKDVAAKIVEGIKDWLKACREAD